MASGSILKQAHKDIVKELSTYLYERINRLDPQFFLKDIINEFRLEFMGYSPHPEYHTSVYYYEYKDLLRFIDEHFTLALLATLSKNTIQEIHFFEELEATLIHLQAYRLAVIPNDIIINTVIQAIKLMNKKHLENHPLDFEFSDW